MTKPSKYHDKSKTTRCDDGKRIFNLLHDLWKPNPAEPLIAALKHTRKLRGVRLAVKNHFNSQFTGLVQSLSTLYNRKGEGEKVELLQCLAQVCSYQDLRRCGFTATEGQYKYARSRWNHVTDQPRTATRVRPPSKNTIDLENDGDLMAAIIERTTVV
ncbi:hypothetical protein BLNAU_23542 [Blattamonas nauphoetae]|uniref:Uncharacterized protein n=1 Tax=Blattamonas nauphoetae TaxID=2049346 RepID=A0ABQ9WR14_9EUKA|nr:hypothetical protein BLNAU_23542 [Blattamonas nauphoetae]